MATLTPQLKAQYKARLDELGETFHRVQKAANDSELLSSVYQEWLEEEGENAPEWLRNEAAKKQREAEAAKVAYDLYRKDSLELTREINERFASVCPECGEPANEFWNGGICEECRVAWCDTLAAEDFEDRAYGSYP